MTKLRGLHWSPPLILLVVVAAIWQSLAKAWEIPAVLLPTPTQIVAAVYEHAGTLLSAAMVTAAAAVSGLCISTIVGTMTAMVFSQSVIIRRSCYPYAIFLQTVPIVAIAPLIVIWIGEGFLAVTTIALIISLFPIITNATDGLLQVDRGLVDLFRMYNATRWQSLRYLRLPHAMPQILTGIKIASATAVLGAIVGEFFAGAGANRPGLGYLIYSASGQYRLDFLFAAIFACTVLGVVIFYTVSAVGSKILDWSDAERVI